jgi:hypothetical protein
MHLPDLLILPLLAHRSFALLASCTLAGPQWHTGPMFVMDTSYGVRAEELWGSSKGPSLEHACI